MHSYGNKNYTHIIILSYLMITLIYVVGTNIIVYRMNWQIMLARENIIE